MHRLVSIVTITLALGACSRQDRGPAEASGYSGRNTGAVRDDASSAPEYAPSPASGAAQAAPPSAAPKAESRAMEAERDERPGLGTEWGETRSSRVSSAPFERSDENGPFAVTSLFYNDANGVRAMTRDASLGAAARDGVDVAGGALSVRLLDASGRPLPTYDFGSRRFVVGSDGERYVVQIQNHTGNRIEAVATVDGLDVIDGRPGSFEKRGYLLGPWATVEIDGFRQNFEQVAAFRFGAVRDAYAAKKGDDRNVGVIGVAFFAEQNAPYPWLEREGERRRRAEPFPGRFAEPPGY